MSDYMFMLESHLTPSQSKVVAAVEAAASEADANVFLTGGAMRDMMGGFPITDLDFTVEGNALTLAKKVAKSRGTQIVATNAVRKSTELLFPEGVTAEIAMSRTERYAKPGGRPEVRQATIHEDLLRRDFTINAIALSLTPASRGLLLDPSNGLADIERRELRAPTNFTFYDDAVRLLRLIRFRVRLGFTVQERTQRQYESARAAGMESHISSGMLLRELRSIADEPNVSELVVALEQERLIHLFSPALSGQKLNQGALAKLQRARQLIPYGMDLNLDSLGLFLYFLTERLTPREKLALATNLRMSKRDLVLWQKLESRSRKLQSHLKSPDLHRPSQVYQRLRDAPGDEVLFLYLRCPERLVHDRIRNYLQKYLLAAQEITDRDIAAAGVEPGTPMFQKTKQEMIAARLDGRKWQPAARPTKGSRRAKKK